MITKMTQQRVIADKATIGIDKIGYKNNVN